MPKSEEHKEENLLGAIARGTIDGGQLAFNVAIMLISFLALVALINGIFGGTHNFLGAHHIHFPVLAWNAILGLFFAPVAWLIGIPWHDARMVGNLLGTRMVINELVPTPCWARRKRQLICARSPSPLSLCAASQISAPSACRSAASALWHPHSAAILHDSASAP